MHNLPIIDINPGNTISEMVEIINRNFDIIDQKGGGPMGIQGIQGINGFPGEQGITGATGPSGTGWVPFNSAPINEGDLSVDENGNIWQVQNNGGTLTWVQTGQSITGLGESPFTYSDNAIHPKQAYVDKKTVLGAATSTTNAVLNIVQGSGADAISIYQQGGGTPIKITSETSENKLKVFAKEIVLLSDGNASVTVKQTGNCINLSPLKNTSIPNNIRQIVSANKDGDIEEQSNWTWGLCNNSIIPNKNLSNKTVGDDDNRIDGVCFAANSELNFIGSDDRYLNVNAKPNAGGSAKTVARFSSYGLSVGDNGTQVNRNANTLNNGIVIGGGNGKNGHLTFLGSSSTTNYVNTESAVSPSTDTSVNAPTYTLNVNPQQDNSFADNAPIITVGATSNNRISNLLHIKGATLNNMRGADVFVEGGESVGDWNNNYQTGGNVYLAGGKNRNTSNVGGGTLSGSLYHFGDVIVGLNPSNHPKLWANDNLKASKRGVSKDDINGVSFYDICNFTAHGNVITLDSDANNRVVNGYNEDGLCPNLQNPEQSTFKVNGLMTLHRSTPLSIPIGDANKYQMLSGVYNVAIAYYTQGGTLKYKRADTVYDAVTAAINSFSPIEQHAGVRVAVSYINTVWNKIGNIVTCNTRVDMYSYGGRAFGGYSVFSPFELNMTTQGPVFGTSSIDYIISNGIITNIELPVFLATGIRNSTPIRTNYVTGNGFVHTERPTSSTTMSVGTDSSVTVTRKTLADSYFIPDNQVFVNNNTNYTDPTVVTNYSYTLDYNNQYQQSWTNKHNANATLKDQNIKNNMPKSYLNTDNILAGGLKPLLIPISQACAYIIPEYSNVLSARRTSPYEYYETFRKLVPMNKPYTSMSINYSYLLNPDFDTTEYKPFAYDDGGLPIWVEPGEIPDIIDPVGPINNNVTK